MLPGRYLNGAQYRPAHVHVKVSAAGHVPLTTQLYFPDDPYNAIDPFIKNKQIVFMGDGTFFHSGAVAISNAIKARQDICFIILENGTTAMTGHQEHPGTEVDVLGNETPLQDIHKIVKSMQSTDPFTVVKMTPANREKYYGKLEKLILQDGVKVMIADKECGITYHRREGKKERETIKKIGFLPEKTHMNITQEVCEHCLQCTKQTVCPGLTATAPGMEAMGARPIPDGAASVVWAATLPDDGPSGGFFRDGQAIPW